MILLRESLLLFIKAEFTLSEAGINSVSPKKPGILSERENISELF